MKIHYKEYYKYKNVEAYRALCDHRSEAYYINKDKVLTEDIGAVTCGLCKRILKGYK